jgi:hypothetical protein
MNQSWRGIAYCCELVMMKSVVEVLEVQAMHLVVG